MIRNPTIRRTKWTTYNSLDRRGLVSCCTLSLRSGPVWSFGQCVRPCHRHSETCLLLVCCPAHHQSSRGFSLCSIWRINILILEYLGILSLYIIVDSRSQRCSAFPRYPCSHSCCPFCSRNSCSQQWDSERIFICLRCCNSSVVDGHSRTFLP